MGSTADPAHQRNRQQADTEAGPEGPAAVREHEEEEGRTRAGPPAWVLSIGLHGVVALIFASLVYVGREPVVELPPWMPPPQTPSIPRPEQPPVVAIQPRPEIDTTQIADEAAPITPIEVKPDLLDTTDATPMILESRAIRPRFPRSRPAARGDSSPSVAVERPAASWVIAKAAATTRR